MLISISPTRTNFIPSEFTRLNLAASGSSGGTGIGSGGAAFFATGFFTTGFFGAVFFFVAGGGVRTGLFAGAAVQGSAIKTTPHSARRTRIRYFAASSTRILMFLNATSFP
jgi:lipid-binding SYLF domain-containing protein